jgi:hypothetical protein
MGEKGLEPIRPFGHTVLSRARLPVPPPAHSSHPAPNARDEATADVHTIRNTNYVRILGYLGQ